jgi:hypothetical protein
MKLNNMCRLAVSVAIAVGAGSAWAGTVTTASDKFSKQFAAREAAVSATSTQILPNVAYTAAAAGLSGDRITVTLGGTAGANFSKTSTNATTADAATAHFGSLACGATALTQVSGTATTRVFEVPAAGCAAGAYTFSNATLLNSTLNGAAGSTITIAVRNDRLATVVETAGEAVVATVEDQFVASTVAGTRWKGQIDSVNNSRTYVATSTTGGSTTTDTLIIDVDNITVVNAATVDAAIGGVLTLTGDWSFLRNSTETCSVPLAATANKIVVTDVSTTLAIGTLDTASTTCSQIVINLSGVEVAGLTNAADQLKVEIVNTAATGNKLSAQTFGGSFAFKYSTAASTVTQTKTDAVTAGANTATGVTAFVPYMPVGAGISQVLYLTNNSNASGSVSITSRDSAGTLCSAYPAVTAAANSVVNLGTALATGIAACGGATTTNKLALTITAQIPDGGMEVYSAYNVNGDRVNVVNSTNGRSAAGGVGADNSTP